MEGDPNVGSSSSSAIKKRKKTSKVWDEMRELNIDGKVIAQCKHCKKTFDGSSKKGTTHLNNHLQRCPANPKRKSGSDGRDRDDQDQSLSPSIKTKELASLIKEKENSIRGLIMHLSDPEGDTSDREWYPWLLTSRENEILQRLKSRKDGILKLYEEEKENLCQFLNKRSCRFTLQIANGRVLVVHYIDDCWEWQSKIIKFWEDPLDDFENLVEAVEQSCLDWKIDTNICFLLHVDRNELEEERHDAIVEMLRGFSQRRSLPFASCLPDAGYFEDFIDSKLETVDYLRDGIESLEWCADYVHNKDRRFFLLDGAVKQAISELSIDTTFWGLLKFFETIVGLEVGLQEFFSELEKLDSDFRSVNLTKQKWDEVTATFEHLKFLEYVADIFLWKACDIPIIVDLPYVHKILTDRCNHTIEDCLFCQEVMKEAIDLFFCKHYLVRVIAVILDPRFKMDGLQLRYKEIYGSDADRYLEKVNKDFRDVCDAYSASNSESYEMLDALGRPSSPKSELDRYFDSLKVPRDKQFNVLAWWRGNEPSFPTLARMARDYLALGITSADDAAKRALFDLIDDVDYIDEFREIPEIITHLLLLK